MGNVFDVVKLQGMSGIRSSLKTSNYIVFGSEYINQLSLAFITPLKAQ
jgi:hypothetical protein